MRYAITTATDHHDADADTTITNLAHHNTHISIAGPGLSLLCTHCHALMPADIPLTDDGHATGPHATAHDGHTHTPTVTPTTWAESVEVQFDAPTDTVSVGINLGTGGLFALTIHRSVVDGAIILTTPTPASTAAHAHLEHRAHGAWTIHPNS